MDFNEMVYKNYLSHHGIKGQKWGIRRYQNEDGTLTAEGIARYREKGRQAFLEIHSGAIREAKKYGDDTQSFSRANRNVSDKFKQRFSKAQDEVLNRHRKELDEADDNVKKAINKYGFGLINKKKNETALKEARAKLEAANQDYFNDMYTTSLDVVNSLPKDQRDKAKAYVYNMLDW